MSRLVIDFSGVTATGTRVSNVAFIVNHAWDEQVVWDVCDWYSEMKLS